MNSEFAKAPIPQNEPELNYTPGSKERTDLGIALKELRLNKVNVFMYIGDKLVMSQEEIPIIEPHDHKNSLGIFFRSNEKHLTEAINEALIAKKQWQNSSFYERAAILLKSADLLTVPYRQKMIAAIMLGQSKNVHQAEIDVRELADFWRFNVSFAEGIYSEQPQSTKDEWNSNDHRPQEGFIWALTPFNFAAIAGNLPTAPALMANTIVWKPSNSQVLSANLTMEILKEAGMPAGVINLVYPSGPTAAEVILSHPDFAGIHFTGSTEVFQQIWQKIGTNIKNYKTYPRIVGETGGKNSVLAHESADPKVVATALIRGAFEYQGQKCSAASRAYIPKRLWKEVKELMVDDLKGIKMGPPDDFSCFINAVINEEAFDKITAYIDCAKNSKEAQIVYGGGYDKSIGYFIEPTIIETTDPSYITMKEEIFGPVLTVYPYESYMWNHTLRLINETSPYGLTGSIFAQDRKVIEEAKERLRFAAGNFYINDKPTGAVVGRQPFGGARLSGTNDKAGSPDNLRRWISTRVVKENFLPPKDYRYPFLSSN